MKTDTQGAPVAAQSEKQDYELARDEARQLLAKTGITAEVSKPVGGVGENDWPHIAYTVTFSRAGQVVTLPYRLGVGHVRLPKLRVNQSDNYRVLGMLHLSGEEEILLWHWSLKPGAKFSNLDVQASVAAKLALSQKVAPDPAEVLASWCRDSMAHEITFEEWASECGHDTDSRKAEATYRECADAWHGLARLLGRRELVEKMAELSNRF